MKTEIVTKEYAAKFSQTKTFGVISDGCTGVWGEGDTIEDAVEDAKINQEKYAGAVNIDICYAMEIQ